LYKKPENNNIKAVLTFKIVQRQQVWNSINEPSSIYIGIGSYLFITTSKDGQFKLKWVK